MDAAAGAEGRRGVTGVAVARDPHAADYIGDQTKSLQMRLSKSDSQRLDLFLTSVRNIETRVLNTNVMVTQGRKVVSRPPLASSTDTFTGSGNGAVMAGYDRNARADVMIDLIVMALPCDLTRVITFIDDARHDFFLKLRNFTVAGSAPATTSVTNGNISSGLSGFHGLQHAGDTNDGFATIDYWLTEKPASPRAVSTMFRVRQDLLGHAQSG